MDCALLSAFGTNASKVIVPSDEKEIGVLREGVVDLCKVASLFAKPPQVSVPEPVGCSNTAPATPVGASLIVVPPKTSEKLGSFVLLVSEDAFNTKLEIFTGTSLGETYIRNDPKVLPLILPSELGIVTEYPVLV